nr:type I 3-dehydroquinate dehydratase [Ramlibacter sp.]
MQAKAIELRGGPVGGGRVPAVCAPLVGRTREALLAEVAAVAARKPDILEWRVDFFEAIA